MDSPVLRKLTLNAASRESNTVDELAEFMTTHSNSFVITGAGISSGSGIPTYRDDRGTWKSNRPIQHAEFMRAHSIRQRYWARSFSGWPTIEKAQPNLAHVELANLEALNFVGQLVTQNVDRLHQRANHRQVIDLHGRLDQVLCMDCGALIARSDIQDWLKEHNTHLHESSELTRPDGDADVDDGLVKAVQVPSCYRCSGVLKPNVVFYGSSVDKGIVASIYEKILISDSLLIVGSSLMVYSSYRFCKFAAENNIPIACINQGLTRADDLLTLKVSRPCAESLQALATSLR
ncbi:MAG: NAD-dependent SIR2 family protein deacetylase [Pseudohongiellaceae bacterium]|jgi:NAD-dependent SIR2 family protein deacetylase